MGSEREIQSLDVCANCGKRAHEHRLGNFADGPHVGLEFLVCPVSTFQRLTPEQEMARFPEEPDNDK